MTGPDLEGNGPSTEPVDDTTAQDTADYEADLTGEPVLDVDPSDEAVISDDLLAQADTSEPEPT